MLCSRKQGRKMNFLNERWITCFGNSPLSNFGVKISVWMLTGRVQHCCPISNKSAARQILTQLTNIDFPFRRFRHFRRTDGHADGLLDSHLNGAPLEKQIWRDVCKWRHYLHSWPNYSNQRNFGIPHSAACARRHACLPSCEDHMTDHRF
jgi:hypothetical protein